MKKKVFLPQYRKIADDLRRKIRMRVWEYGEKLPAKAELCRRYRVSLITVKAAIRSLISDGMVRTVRGAGTFVNWKREQDFFTPRPSGKPEAEIVHSLLKPLPAESYTMNLLAENFMAQNPQVRIRFVELNNNAETDPYFDLFNSEDVPSCGEFFWHAIYARLNALYPLENFSDFAEFRQELLPQAFSLTPDGGNVPHFHGVNLYLGIPLGFMVNCDLLRRTGVELPEKRLSWPRLRRLCGDFFRRNRAADICSLALKLPNSYHGVKPFVELMGQDLFCRSNEPVTPESFRRIFSSESAAVALELLLRLGEAGECRFDQCDEYFALGKAALLPFANNWSARLLEILNPNLDTLFSAVPPVGGNNRYCSFYSGFTVGIFRHGIRSDYQLQMTWQWLRFLFYRRSQYLFSQSLKLPVRKEADSFLRQRYPGLSQTAGEMLQNAVPQPDFVGMRQAYAAVGRSLNALFRKEFSIEKCLAKIREDLAIQFL